MRRAILFACLTALAAACGSQSTQGPKPAPWKDDPGLAPPSLTRPDDNPTGTASAVQGTASKGEAAPAAPAAAIAPPATTPEPDIPPAQPDAVDVSTDTVPASATSSRPCEVPNCGVVLSISGKQRWQIEVQMHDGSVRV